jgi:antitoxin component of MazEF toxin-antitoxin module
LKASVGIYKNYKIKAEWYTMQTQTIFKAGNSEVVAIPKHILKEMKLGNGQKIIIEKVPNEEIIEIRRVPVKQYKASSTKSEFKKWLNSELGPKSVILPFYIQQYRGQKPLLMELTFILLFFPKQPVYCNQFV